MDPPSTSPHIARRSPSPPYSPLGPILPVVAGVGEAIEHGVRLSTRLGKAAAVIAKETDPAESPLCAGGARRLASIRDPHRVPRRADAGDSVLPGAAETLVRVHVVGHNDCGIFTRRINLVRGLPTQNPGLFGDRGNRHLGSQVVVSSICTFFVSHPMPAAPAFACSLIAMNALKRSSPSAQC